jgi:hypothetical protein
MPNNIVKSFADKTGKDESEVEKLWNKAEEIVKDEYNIEPSVDKFYPLVTGVLKKMLKIDESKFGTLVAGILNEDIEEVLEEGKGKKIPSLPKNTFNKFAKEVAILKDWAYKAEDHYRKEKDRIIKTATSAQKGTEEWDKGKTDYEMADNKWVAIHSLYTNLEKIEGNIERTIAELEKLQGK